MASVATQKPKNKKAIPISARISNRTTTPAYHAVIDIGFDREMLLASSAITNRWKNLPTPPGGAQKPHWSAIVSSSSLRACMLALPNGAARLGARRNNKRRSVFSGAFNPKKIDRSASNDAFCIKKRIPLSRTG
ncbi:MULTISPECIES: hypothetical protein [unclassified Bradyrhizobium]